MTVTSDDWELMWNAITRIEHYLHQVPLKARERAKALRHVAVIKAVVQQESQPYPSTSKESRP